MCKDHPKTLHNVLNWLTYSALKVKQCDFSRVAVIIYLNYTISQNIFKMVGLKCNLSDFWRIFFNCLTTYVYKGFVQSEHKRSFSLDIVQTSLIICKFHLTDLKYCSGHCSLTSKFYTFIKFLFFNTVMSQTPFLKNYFVSRNINIQISELTTVNCVYFRYQTTRT